MTHTVTTWLGDHGLWHARCTCGAECSGWRDVHGGQARASAWARWHELEQERTRPDVIHDLTALLKERHR